LSVLATAPRIRRPRVASDATVRQHIGRVPSPIRVTRAGGHRIARLSRGQGGSARAGIGQPTNVTRLVSFVLVRAAAPASVRDAEVSPSRAPRDCPNRPSERYPRPPQTSVRPASRSRGHPSRSDRCRSRAPPDPHDWATVRMDLGSPRSDRTAVAGRPLELPAPGRNNGVAGMVAAGAPGKEDGHRTPSSTPFDQAIYGPVGSGGPGRWGAKGHERGHRLALVGQDPPPRRSRRHGRPGRHRPRPPGPRRRPAPLQRRASNPSSLSCSPPGHPGPNRPQRHSTSRSRSCLASLSGRTSGPRAHHGTYGSATDRQTCAVPDLSERVTRCRRGADKACPV
jgi:hypothetical protein